MTTPRTSRHPDRQDRGLLDRGDPPLRSGDIGKDDPAHDLPYATLFIGSAKPFDGPDLPDKV